MGRKMIKKQNGFAMVLTLGLLVIMSFGFIISNSETYSNIKNNHKNNIIKEIKVFQHALITSMYQNKWIPDGVYKNSYVCENFGCIKSTLNEIIISSISCPTDDCFSVTILTDYNGLEISKSEVFD